MNHSVSANANRRLPFEPEFRGEATTTGTTKSLRGGVRSGFKAFINSKQHTWKPEGVL